MIWRGVFSLLFSEEKLELSIFKKSEFMSLSPLQPCHSISPVLGRKLQVLFSQNFVQTISNENTFFSYCHSAWSEFVGLIHFRLGKYPQWLLKFTADNSPEAILMEAPQRAAWALAGMQAKPRLPPEPSPSGLHLQCSGEVAWEKNSPIHETYCALAVGKITVSVVVYWYFSRWESYMVP